MLNLLFLACVHHTEVTTTPVSPQTPAITIVDPGAEPRETLRFHPKKGQKDHLLMTMGLKTEIQLGEQVAPTMNIPPIEVNMETTVTDVSKNGTITYDFIFNDVHAVIGADVDPQMVAAMAPQLAAMTGLTGTGMATDRGLTLAVTMHYPETMDETMRQSMETMNQSIGQMSVPFPMEPVGSGARWVVQTNPSSNGITFQQSTEYHILSRHGDLIEAEVTVKQNAAPQDILAPGLAPGSVHLLSFTSTGGGKTQLDIRRLAPTLSHSAVDTKMVSQVTMGSTTVEMTTNIHIDMDIKMP